MTTLSVTEASRKVGVSRQTIYEQIRHGEIKRSSTGIDIAELLRVYPNLANVSAGLSENPAKAQPITGSVVGPETVPKSSYPAESGNGTIDKTIEQAGTVELLVRELEWNKELLEQTNEIMAQQLAEQRALIADQARRLDEKDRFWARQVEIAQSLLPAPAPRKKLFGIF